MEVYLDAGSNSQKDNLLQKPKQNILKNFHLGFFFLKERKFSKYGPWTTNISNIWEFIRNANSQAGASETLGVEPLGLGFNKASGGILMPTQA